MGIEWTRSVDLPVDLDPPPYLSLSALDHRIMHAPAPRGAKRRVLDDNDDDEEEDRPIGKPRRRTITAPKKRRKAWEDSEEEEEDDDESEEVCACGVSVCP